MSSALLVIALLVSFVNIFGPGALAAWGLGGGDGEPRNVGARALALVLVGGLLVTPAIAIRALGDDTPSWWWLSLLPAVAWVVGGRGRPAVEARCRVLRRAVDRRARDPRRRDRDRLSRRCRVGARALRPGATRAASGSVFRRSPSPGGGCSPSVSGIASRSSSVSASTETSRSTARSSLAASSGSPTSFATSRTSSSRMGMPARNTEHLFATLLDPARDESAAAQLIRRSRVGSCAPRYLGPSTGAYREAMRRAGLLLAVLAAVALPAAASSGVANSSPVGTWTRTTTCQELLSALRRAGLGERALEMIVGNSFIPGVRSVGQVKDRAHPCRGAVPRAHSTSSRKAGGSARSTGTATRWTTAGTGYAADSADHLQGVPVRDLQVRDPRRQADPHAGHPEGAVGRSVVRGRSRWGVPGQELDSRRP